MRQCYLLDVRKLFKIKIWFLLFPYFFFSGLRKNPKLLEIIENDFDRLVPSDLNVTDQRPNVSRDMRQFYLGSKQVGIESVDEMIAVSTYF